MSKARIIHDLHDDFGVTISEAEKAYDIALEYIRLRSCGMGDHPEDYEPSEYVLVKASAQQEQRWIPCKEKMPKELTRVLVCTDQGFVCIAYLRSHHKEIDERWFVYGADPDCRGKVIKWMPLPKT